jgi:MFS family permease
MFRFVKENRARWLLGLMTVCVSALAMLIVDSSLPGDFDFLGPLDTILFSILTSSVIVVVVFRRNSRTEKLIGKTGWAIVSIVFWSSLFSILVGLWFESTESEWPGLARLGGSVYGIGAGLLVGIIMAILPPRSDTKTANVARRIASDMAAGISAGAVLGLACGVLTASWLVFWEYPGPRTHLVLDLIVVLVGIILMLMPYCLLFSAITGALASMMLSVASRWGKSPGGDKCFPGSSREKDSTRTTCCH